MEMQPPWKKYSWQTMALVGCIVAMHLYFLSSALIHQTYLTDDSIQYLTIAENLATRGTYSQSFSAPYSPDLQRTPGYPVFLLLLGRLPALILIVQHLLVLGSAWFLYKIAVQLYGPKVASAGTKLYLLQPYPVILASYLLSEVLFIFLLMVAVWGYLRYWQGEGWVALTIGLAALAIATLVRPVALPLLVLAALFSLLHTFRLQDRRWVQFAVAVMVPVLLLGPWYLRNHAVSGHWTISTMGEMGMLHGRLGGLQTMRTDQPMNEHQYFMAGDSIAGMEIGLRQLRHYPADKQTHETEQLVAGQGKRTLLFFWNHPLDALRFEGMGFWEMFKGLGYGWARALSLSKPAAIMAAGMQLVCNMLVFLGAAMAIVRRREWQGPQVIMLVAIVVVLLVSATAWADGRYRMVIDPLIVLMAMFTLRRQEKIHESIPLAVDAE